jgi:hypothetical protein
VITDYERANFSVSQSVFKDNNPEKIVAIYSPSTKFSHPGLSKMTLIAIVVAAVVVSLLLASCGAIFRIRRRRARPVTEEEAKNNRPNSEVAKSIVSGELSGHEIKIELPEGRKPELTGADKDLYHELNAKLFISRPELVGGDGDIRHELDAKSSHRPELVGADQDIRHELATTERLVELPAWSNNERLEEG